ATGSQLAKFMSFADAAPYASANSGSSLSMPCIAPGATGVFYDNGFVATAAPIASTATIALQLSAMKSPGAVPHPDAPTVTGATPTAGLGGGYMQLVG